MAVQQALGIGKPGFELTFEPGFIEGVHLIRRRQLFEFPHEGLTAGLFFIQAVDNHAVLIASRNAVDEVILLRVNQRQFPLDTRSPIELRAFSRPMLGEGLVDGDIHHFLGQRFMERLEHDLIEELLFDQQ